MNTNPIFIVDDDADDHDILQEVFNELELKNEICFFDNGESLLKELSDNPIIPFLIISDLNLPKMDGFQLREKILQNNKIACKTVPFIFWSTAASDFQIQHAYELSAHGFFIKERTYKDIKQSLSEIIAYWSKSKTPVS